MREAPVLMSRWQFRKRYVLIRAQVVFTAWGRCFSPYGFYSVSKDCVYMPLDVVGVPLAVVAIGQRSLYLGLFYYIVINLWKTFFLYFEGEMYTGIWKVDWMWAAVTSFVTSVVLVWTWKNVGLIFYAKLTWFTFFSNALLVSKSNNTSMWHVVPIYKPNKMGR